MPPARSVGADSLSIAHAKKAQSPTSSMPPARSVGADSFAIAHAKKAAPPPSAMPPARSVGADSFAIAHAKKAQTARAPSPDRGRGVNGYAGVKPHVGLDSFSVSHVRTAPKKTAEGVNREARSISVTQRAAALNDASHFGRALVDSAESPPLSYLAGASGASGASPPMKRGHSFGNQFVPPAAAAAAGKAPAAAAEKESTSWFGSSKKSPEKKSPSAATSWFGSSKPAEKETSPAAAAPKVAPLNTKAPLRAVRGADGLTPRSSEMVGGSQKLDTPRQEDIWKKAEQLENEGRAVEAAVLTSKLLERHHKEVGGPKAAALQRQKEEHAAERGVWTDRQTSQRGTAATTAPAAPAAGGGAPASAAAADTSLIASALASAEGRAELKALFDALDVNGDGAVSSKEWGQGLSKNQALMQKYFGGATAAEVGRQFNRIDADDDRKLTWSEMLAAAGIKDDGVSDLVREARSVGLGGGGGATAAAPAPAPVERLADGTYEGAMRQEGVSMPLSLALTFAGGKIEGKRANERGYAIAGEYGNGKVRFDQTEAAGGATVSFEGTYHGDKLAGKWKGGGVGGMFMLKLKEE